MCAAITDHIHRCSTGCKIDGAKSSVLTIYNERIVCVTRTGRSQNIISVPTKPISFYSAKRENSKADVFSVINELHGDI